MVAVAEWISDSIQDVQSTLFLPCLYYLLVTEVIVWSAECGVRHAKAV